MNEDLDAMIQEKLAAGRYMKAARLAVSFGNVIAHELWFAQIGDLRLSITKSSWSR